MRMPGTLLLMLCASLLLPGSSASAGEAAAVIVDYEGAEYVNGTRAGARIKFLLGGVLEEGDKLEIPDPGFVKINRGGSCEWLASPSYFGNLQEGCTTSRAPEYAVPSSGFAGDVAQRYQRLAEVLGWWDPERTVKPMRSREAYQPRVPALDDISKPLVVAGNRVLQVRWVDGKPPFRLVAITPDGARIDGSTSGSTRSGNVSIPVKADTTFQIELTSGDKVVTYDLHGVKAFDEMQSTAAVDDYDRASRIVTAISESNGDWAFEGAQQLSELTLEPRVKTALMNAIEFGDWP